MLERYFEVDKMPTQQAREDLAKKLGMSSRRVQIWFQNKRAKIKRISKGKVVQPAAVAVQPKRAHFDGQDLRAVIEVEPHAVKKLYLPTELYAHNLQK